MECLISVAWHDGTTRKDGRQAENEITVSMKLYDFTRQRDTIRRLMDQKRNLRPRLGNHKARLFTCRLLQQIHFPTTGILRKISAMKAEAANETTAVAKMASGVEMRGINMADTGARMNMCRRYIP